MITHRAGLAPPSPRQAKRPPRSSVASAGAYALVPRVVALTTADQPPRYVPAGTQTGSRDPPKPIAPPLFTRHREMICPRHRSSRWSYCRHSGRGRLRPSADRGPLVASAFAEACNPAKAGCSTPFRPSVQASRPLPLNAGKTT